jgi:hypothetical protein
MYGAYLGYALLPSDLTASSQSNAERYDDESEYEYDPLLHVDGKSQKRHDRDECAEKHDECVE